jgi:hypothetical protein
LASQPKVVRGSPKGEGGPSSQHISLTREASRPLAARRTPASQRRVAGVAAQSGQRPSRFTGQWHHLHHWSCRVIGWAQAGHCSAGASCSRRGVAVRARRIFPSGVGRAVDECILGGAPGRRM